jgi:hypothetical protein
MARFRKKRSRRTFGGFKTKSRRSSGSSSSDMDVALGAIAYGATRQYVASWITPVTTMLPFGNLNDEVGMLGVSYAVNRWAPLGKYGKAYGKAGITIELAKVAENALSGLSGNSNNSTVFTYG